MQRLKMHPDLGGDHEKAALINEAYATLMDVDARARYDETLAAPGRGPVESPGFGAPRGEGPDRKRDRPSREKVRPGTGGSNAQSNRNAESGADSQTQCLFCGQGHSALDALDEQGTCRACDSPLYAASAQSAALNDKRAIERIQRKYAVTVRPRFDTAATIRAETLDVSLQGMQIDAAESLQAGQIVRIASGMLDAVARVVAVRESAASARWHIGLQFLTLRIRRSQGGFVSIEA